MVRPQAKPSHDAPRAWVGYRSKHRQKSHDDAHAHANGDAAPPPLLIEHPLVPSGPAELVTEQPQLDALIDTLRDAGQLGYDTEFIGEQSYFPRLCLVQVATAEDVWLIDPLHSLDLSGFWRLLTDPAVETVVHAGLQDLEPMPRRAGGPVGRVFDTQVAAGFAGLDYPASLSRLVDTLIGGELDQGPKFSRWDQRPLSRLQRAYAANDVRYLLLVRQRVLERVEACGNAEALAEEHRAMRHLASQAGPPSLDKLKARGVAKLSRRRRTRLTALVAWRDAAAQRLDMPPRAVVGDDTLVALAIDKPEDEASLRETKGLPRPVKEQFSGELLRVLAESETLPLVAAARRSKKPSDEAKRRMDELWAAVQAACESRGIATALACNRKDIAAWATSRRGRKALRGRLCEGWRGRLLGPLLEPFDPPAPR